jgi:uncharacterized membrane protein
MSTQQKDSKPDFPLTRENYILLMIGFIIIAIGLLLMLGGGSEDQNVFNEKELFSFRRITLAPIVILFGFIFEIYAIMKKPRQNNEKK